MHDQVTNHDATSGTSPQSASVAANQQGTDVLRIIADVEGHLTRLRSAQKQQDDAISSLTARSKALRAAEEELDRQRVALKQQQMQVERDRASLQGERDQFGDQCKRMDEDLRRRAGEVEQSQQRLERERTDIASQHEHARRGLAELEQAKSVWQQHHAQAEEQLKRSQSDIDARLAECAKAKDDIATARSQWEKQRQDAQARLDARGQELDQQVAAIAQRESRIQQERDQLATDQQQSRRQREELENRAAALESERTELLARVDQAERNVGELIEQVERGQQELIEQSRAMKDAMEKIAALQQREHALEKAADQAGAQARRAEKEARELLQLAESERNEVQAKLDSARTEFEKAREARDAAMAELESSRKKIASLQRDLKSRDEELTAKDAQVSDLYKKLELAGGKLSEFAQVLGEQTPQLERGAAALAMCEEQAEQIDRLTKQLAELQLASDPEEIQRRDARINELTEALRQSRGQNGGDVSVAEIEQRNAALERDLQHARLEAQNAQIAADEARKQLQAYVDSGAEAQVKDVALAEHAAKIAALTAEIERQNTLSAKELEQKLSAQSKKHQQEMATAREYEQVAAKLRQKISDLEARLAKSKAETANAEASGSDGDGEYVARLRAKAEQITTVADHLRRRRARLEKMRRLMQQKQQAAPTASAQANVQIRNEQLGQIERERQHLLEVRKMLAQSEYKMIRRWARQRAVFVAVGLMFVIAASAAATWFGVDHFFPAVRSASVVLEARHRTGSPMLTDEQKQEWTNWHAEIVRDPGFQQTLAKRMAERQMTVWARPEAIVSRLAQDFAVDSSQNGMVIYSMSGTDPDAMTAFLDILAHTVVTESTRQGGRRIDGAVTTATGERKVEGRVCYASINPAPVLDERMKYAMPIFGGTLGAMLLISLVSYIKLARTKRVFDEENDALFQDVRAGTSPA